MYSGELKCIGGMDEGVLEFSILRGMYRYYSGQLRYYTEFKCPLIP